MSLSTTDDPMATFLNRGDTAKSIASEAQILRVELAAARAAAAFRVSGWTWQDNPQPPTTKEIEATLWSLIGGCVKNRGGSSGTGRLTAEVDEDGDIGLFLELGSLISVLPAVDA